MKLARILASIVILMGLVAFFQNCGQFTVNPNSALESSSVVSHKKFKIVEGNSSSACAVSDKKEVYCWSEANPQPVKIEGMASVVDLKMAYGLTVALAEDNVAYCSNYYGKDVTEVAFEPCNGGTLTGIAQISMPNGDNTQLCILKLDNSVWCGWKVDALTKISGLPAVEKLASSSATFGCAIGVDKNLYCWSDGQYGIYSELGITGTYTAKKIAGIANLKDASVGSLGSHICAILDTGEVQCAGYLMDSYKVWTANNIFFPWETVPGIANAETIEVTWGRYCVKKDTGVITCWGKLYTESAPNRPESQLYTSADQTKIMDLPYFQGAVDFRISWRSACGINPVGRIYCANMYVQY